MTGLSDEALRLLHRWCLLVCTARSRLIRPCRIGNGRHPDTPCRGEPSKILRLVNVVQHPMRLHGPLDLTQSTQCLERHGVGAPGHVVKKKGMKPVQAQQRVAAVSSRHQRSVMNRQRSGGASEVVDAHLRAVGADQQHGFTLGDRSLGRSRHASTQIPLSLLRPFEVFRYVQRFPNGIMPARCHAEFNRTDPCIECRFDRMFKHSPSQSSRPLGAQGGDEPRFGIAWNRRFRDDDDACPLHRYASASWLAGTPRQ